MTAEWLQPQAWWGLAALAVPVLIHLLTRARSRRVAFPTLRFLRQARVSAFRQRRISDPLLLVVRMLAIATAVAALAAPVFVSDARRAEWDRRVARAVVLVGEAGAEAQAIAAEEAARAAFAETFTAEHPADALRAAREWLRDAPPASRELLIAGDVRGGQIARSDLDPIPASTGIRVLPLPAAADGGGEAIGQVAIADVGGAPQGLALTITPAPTRTEVSYRAVPVDPPITVEAEPEQQARAEAILRAVLRDGLLVTPPSERRVHLVFADADAARAAEQGPGRVTAGAAINRRNTWTMDALAEAPGARGAIRGDRFVITLPMPASDPRAPEVVARVLSAAYAQPLDDREPRRIPAATLAAWERPAGPSPAGVPAVDEGDRRWLWLLALALLGIEQWLRRERRLVEEELPVEARVA